MRLGLMQPYFFPYLGYFSLIDAVDRWVAYDTPQFPRHGWVHRNRVLSKGASEWKYVRVPTLKSPLGARIRDVVIDRRKDWLDVLLRNLDYYRDSRAPYYSEVTGFLKTACSGDQTRLCPFVIATLNATCEYLGIHRTIEVFSELECDTTDVHGSAEDTVRFIAQSLGATTYVNLPGGRSLYCSDAFSACGIDLRFIAPSLPAYSQGDDRSVPGLSVIDALMWNSPRDVLRMITRYEVSA